MRYSKNQKTVQYKHELCWKSSTVRKTEKKNSWHSYVLMDFMAVKQHNVRFSTTIWYEIKECTMLTMNMKSNASTQKLSCLLIAFAWIKQGFFHLFFYSIFAIFWSITVFRVHHNHSNNAYFGQYGSVFFFICIAVTWWCRRHAFEI